MPDVGIGISYGALGLLTGLAATFVKARLSGAKKAAEPAPDHLRVELRESYATKRELRELEERTDRRLTFALAQIRDDITGLRKDIKDFNDAAEARVSATHKRIDKVMDQCAARKGGCE